MNTIKEIFTIKFTPFITLFAKHNANEKNFIIGPIEKFIQHLFDKINISFNLNLINLNI